MTGITTTSPVPVHHYASSIRHLPSRGATRPTTSRQSMKPSPVAPDAFRQSYTRPSDSSDDEDLAPIKLSAEAQALLEGEIQHFSSKKSDHVLDSQAQHRQELSNNQSLSSQRRDGSPIRSSRHTSATRPSPPAVLERDGSFAYKYHDKSKSFGALHHDSKTPAPRLRKVRVSGSRSQTKSPSSAEYRDRILDRGAEEEQRQEKISDDLSPEDEPAQNDPATVARPRRTREGGHSTIRAHRIGTGTLLNGHVRRRAIRRLSQDEEAQDSDGGLAAYSPEAQQGRRAEPELDNKPDDLLIDYGSPQLIGKTTSKGHEDDRTMQRSNSPVPQVINRPLSPPRPTAFSASIGRQPTPGTAQAPNSRSSSSKRPIFKIPSLPPIEPVNDQENEPPPTFRRGKPTATQLEIRAEATLEPEQKSEQPEALHESPRQPLGPRQNNTPLRAAPAPPPKMSLIEAATSNAGNSRSKKVHYTLNGRIYRRLDCIGKGGSSRVFRIMAENYKIFALKRVNLEEADDAAREGYMGEIKLLKKLENVDRVVRLFDHEINEDKGVLNVLMELGETDFYKMLNEQIKSDGAKLNMAFVRYYWKEMLECVNAIHEHDIVHSDLKPPNFLMVKGQLKLIDFGIANAIQNHTVNVYRDNQIGTPNYMSPESLVCHRPAAGRGVGTKTLRLGKPSDVWSLGCILYQMTYGQPPFAHISKPYEKIMSIPDPRVEIQFPNTGIGGAVVPFGLIKTLKRCLQREQSLRPTIRELLSDADPFMNPVAISPNMLERLLGNVINLCRTREEGLRQQGLLGQEGVSCIPSDEFMRKWPVAFYEKLKQAQEEGTAW